MHWKNKTKMHAKQKKFTWKYCNIHLLQCFVWKCVDYATFGKTTLTITRMILTFFFVKIGKKHVDTICANQDLEHIYGRIL